MAEQGHITPEKQLLKLIEGADRKTKMPFGASKAGRAGLSFLSPGAWAGRFSFFKAGFKKGLGAVSFKQLDIELVNKTLVIIACVLFFYFVNSLVFSLIDLRKSPDLGAGLSLKESEVDAQARATFQKPVTYYTEKISSRDIFLIGEKQIDIVNEEGETVSVKASEILEATQNLKLVGISWSNDPDAMIEDTKALRTFFVKKGQMIGKVKVAAIFKDKIILRYGREEIELR